MGATGHRTRHASRPSVTRRAWFALGGLALGLGGSAFGVLAASSPAGAADVSTCPATLAGTTYKKWVGPAGGSYDTSANWSPSGIPGATNIICSDPGTSIVMSTANRVVAGANLQGSLSVGSGRTLTLTANASAIPSTVGLTSVLTDLTLDGTIGGTMPVDLHGANNVLRGTVLGTGAKTITSGSSAQIDGTVTLGTASGAGVLKNAGTLDWTGAGNINLGGSTTVLENLSGGTFNLKESDGYSILDFASSAAKPKFINDAGATITKSTEAGTAYIQAGFDNNGTVSTTSGEIDITLGNTPGGSDAGTYAASGTAVIRLAGGTRTFTGATAATGTSGLTISGGTVNFPAAGTTASTIKQESGTVSGSVTVTGNLTWTGGAQGGSGTTTIDTGATSTSSAFQIGGTRTFRIKGTHTWEPSSYMGLCDTSRVEVENGGKLRIEASGGVSMYQCGTGTAGLVTKAGGTIQKVTATDTTYLQVPFDNKGTVDVDAGNLELATGNSAGTKDTGAWDVASGATTQFTGGTRTEDGATFTGAGTYAVFAGTLDFGATDISIPNVYLAGGAITGNSTITGSMNWTAGTMAGAGTTTINPSITLAIPGGGYIDTGHTLKNKGTVNWLSGYFGICQNALFENASGATFNVVESGGYAVYDCGTSTTTGGILNDAGATIVKSTPGTSYLNVPMDNHGTISATDGDLNVNSNSRPSSSGDTGTWTSSATGDIGLNAGTRLNAGATYTGTATYLNGMTLTGTPTVDHLIWLGGTFDYPGQANVTGTLEVPSGASLNGKLQNAGTIKWQSGYFGVCGTGQIVNPSGGTFEVTAGGSYSIHDCGSSSSKFVNQAGGLVVRKTATDTVLWDLRIDNHGTVRSESGDLAVRAGSPSGSTGDTGTWTATAGADVGFDGGTHHFDGGTLTGASYLNGATLTGTPNVDHATWLSGTFSYPGQANVTGTLTVPSGATLSGKIHNTGTVAWQDGYFGVCGTGQIDNDSGGTFEVTAGGNYSLHDCGASTTFTNRAGATIIRKTATDNVFWDIDTENDGLVQVKTGGVTMRHGSVPGTSDAGTYTVDASAGLAFEAGARNFASTGLVDGAGTAYWSGSTLTGSPTFAAASVAWSAAGPSGSGTTTLAPAATLEWNGVSFSTGGHIVNKGTAHWNGYIGMSNGSTFVNEGLFTAAGGTYAFSDHGGTDPLFTNAATGTLRSANGSDSTINVPFHNAGTINTVNGSISFNGPAGAFDNLVGTSLVGGTYDLQDGLGLPGANIQSLSGATVILDGTVGGIYQTGTSTDAMSNLSAINATSSLTVKRSYALTTNLVSSGGVTVGSASTFGVGSYASTGSTELATATSKLVSGGGTGPVAINSGGTLTGIGTVEGNVSGNGTVSPRAAAVGKLSITGNHSPGSTSTLAVDISGTGVAGTAYDQLAVSGTANLTGTLAITTAPGYTPTVGDSFTILTAGTRTGTFSGITGDSLPGDLYYAVHYTGGAVALTVTELPVVSIDDAVVTEPSTGTATLTFPVTLSDPANRTVTVPWSTSDGTAKEPGDYAAGSGTLTFNPGDPLTQDVTVTVKSDALDEDAETVKVDLGTPTNAGMADAQGVGTIADDAGDLPPAASVDDVTVTEGDASDVTATFHVTLDAPSGRTATVAYTTNDGTAGGDDYVTASGTVTFAPGDTSEDVAVTVKGDLLDEASETYTVDLSSPSNATIADAQGVGTITDNGDPQPSVSVGDATVTEGDAGTVTATFHIGLSAHSGRTVSVPYSTQDDSASSPADYTATSGTATISAGGDGTDVTVLVKGDTVDEADESFKLNLGTPTNATVGDGQGLGTILDDDTAAGNGPSTRPENGFRVGDLRVVEGDTATFTISRTGSTAEAASVKYATSDTTALAGLDYGAVPSTVASFAAGQATKTVTVSTSADAAVEANETFKLSLSSPTNGVVIDSMAVATIDDPGSFPAALSVGDVIVNEGGTASFTVTRSGDTSETSKVTVATANGTALDPGDYTAVAPTELTFAPSEATKVVTVATGQNGTDATKNLTFSLKLSKQVNATVADTAATATIVDDEGAPVATKGIFVAVDDVRVTEGDTATVTIRRRGGLASTATVKVATADGTALAASDYTAVPTTTVTFGPNELAKTISVATTEGSAAESSEALSVKLSSPSTNAVTEDSTAVVTINDDDQVLPQLAVDDVKVREGQGATFTITRTGDTSLAATVKYATSNVTAVDGADYAGAALTSVSFAPGDATKTVTVPTAADAASELLETFRITLSVPTNVIIGDSQGTATIIDAGADPAAFKVADVDVAEGGTAQFTVTRTGDTSQTATVKVATADGTAVAPGDYAGVGSTVLTFGPGESTKAVDVATVDNGSDATVKNLTFSLKLSAATNAGIADSAAIGTIVDDEGASIAVKANHLSVADVRIDEGGNAVVTITRRGATSSVTSVKVATSGGTATAGGDYTPVASTVVTFGAGETTKTVTIASAADSVAELTETFNLGLSAPATNAAVEDNAAVVTILDND